MRSGHQLTQQGETPDDSVSAHCHHSGVQCLQCLQCLLSPQRVKILAPREAETCDLKRARSLYGFSVFVLINTLNPFILFMYPSKHFHCCKIVTKDECLKFYLPYILH